MFPERYIHSKETRRLFGGRVDRLGTMLDEGDPLADEAAAALATLSPPRREELIRRMTAGDRPSSAPEAVTRFFAHVHHVPFWVDDERCDRGGAAFLRTGLFGGFVLAFRSLVMGYCSPAGNKPLTFSGRLKTAAPRRLSETGRFVEAVCLPGGMRPGAPGFATTVRVRLMHAQVRRLLAGSPQWNARAWGLPINQLDMAGTVLLFSLVLVDGLRRLGVQLSPDETEDLMHLWRYNGYVMGVREELLSATEHEARPLWDLITTTQAPPDEDSVALTEALIQSPRLQAHTPDEVFRAERAIEIGYGISRYLIGDEAADALGYPQSAWRFVGPLLRVLLSGTSQLMRRVPGVDMLALNAGMTYWRRAVSMGLGGDDATFEMPQNLSV
jgi:ER-bound oxygenase mpaB/B'/Rubber oxygenase, catalytic domain